MKLKENKKVWVIRDVNHQLLSTPESDLILYEIIKGYYVLENHRFSDENFLDDNWQDDYASGYESHELFSSYEEAKEALIDKYKSQISNKFSKAKSLYTSALEDIEFLEGLCK